MAPEPITRLLQAVARGEQQARERLLERVYGELRDLAGRLLRREDAASLVQATMLVHDAWLSLAGTDPDAPVAFERRAHFFGAAARAMRRVLVDHARARQADRRGGDRLRVTLSGCEPADERWAQGAAVLNLHEALAGLERVSEACAQVVELRFFAGLTIDETALALGCSAPTVKRHWQFARAWLHDRLREEEAR
ncbi:MAG: ECF-type sigma factor [Planctomycetota bacterium]